MNATDRIVVRVRLFARARDLAGTDSLELDLPAGTNVGEMRKVLTERCPALKDFMPRCALAVNDEFAGDPLPLTAGCEVALLPPVSGG